MNEPIPTNWKRVMRAERERKPHFVYELRDRNGQALYVGCTVELPVRLRAHMGKEWWVFVEDVRATRHPDRHTATRAELNLIRDLQPLYNVQATEWGNAAIRERGRTR